MQFDLEKCAKGTIRKGSFVKSKIISLVINTEINELECNNTYKYQRIN